MSVADWAQSVASVVAALSLALGVFQLWRTDRAQRDAERKSLEAKQIEIYQRLEIQSNAVFQFEAAHKAVLPMFKTHLAPPNALSGLKDVDRAEAQLIARKYYEICCNLFEIAARLRRLGYVQPEVFGSWVAWYFDTLCEWGFRALWADLRDNYTHDLRSRVFDSSVAELIAEWDLAPRTETPSDLCKPTEEVEALRVRFYERISQNFDDCPEINTWLARSRGDTLQHPQAFR